MRQADKILLGKNQFINLIEHLSRAKLRKYTPMKVLPNGNKLVQVDKKWLPLDKFNELYPPIPLLFKVRENPDRRLNFINNKTCLK